MAGLISQTAMVSMTFTWNLKTEFRKEDNADGGLTERRLVDNARENGR